MASRRTGGGAEKKGRLGERGKRSPGTGVYGPPARWVRPISAGRSWAGGAGESSGNLLHLGPRWGLPPPLVHRHSSTVHRPPPRPASSQSSPSPGGRRAGAGAGWSRGPVVEAARGGGSAAPSSSPRRPRPRRGARPAARSTGPARSSTASATRGLAGRAGALRSVVADGRGRPASCSTASRTPATYRRPAAWFGVRTVVGDRPRPTSSRPRPSGRRGRDLGRGVPRVPGSPVLDGSPRPAWRAGRRPGRGAASGGSWRGGDGSEAHGLSALVAERLRPPAGPCSSGRASAPARSQRGRRRGCPWPAGWGSPRTPVSCRRGPPPVASREPRPPGGIDDARSDARRGRLREPAAPRRRRSSSTRAGPPSGARLEEVGRPPAVAWRA